LSNKITVNQVGLRRNVLDKLDHWIFGAPIGPTTGRPPTPRPAPQHATSLADEAGVEAAGQLGADAIQS
jgi:hypothetical protein